MRAFSTFTFVVALALLQTAFCATSTMVKTYYNSDTCTDYIYADVYDLMASDDSTADVAAATCAALATTTCVDALESGFQTYTMTTCVSDSLTALIPSASSGYMTYSTSDSTCATPYEATFYNPACILDIDDTDSYYYGGAKCDGNELVRVYDQDSCGKDVTGNTLSTTTCAVGQDEFNSDDLEYTKAFCGSSSDDVCFSGEDTLTLESGEAKRLSEVAIGDKVQTADASGVLSFSEIVALPHAANNKLASFVNVATASGKSVKATKMHLLQQCDGSLAYAGSLTAGDCLRTVDGNEAVTAVSMTTAKGIYTAVTNNEFLVVNGIVASPFAVTHDLVNAYYNLHRFVAKVFPSALKSPLVLAANAFLGGAFLTAGKSK